MDIKTLELRIARLEGIIEALRGQLKEERERRENQPKVIYQWSPNTTRYVPTCQPWYPNVWGIGPDVTSGTSTIAPTQGYICTTTAVAAF